MARYATIEQLEYPPLRKLIARQAARKNWAKVRQLGEMALYLNPFDADLHLTLGQAYGALGVAYASIYELDSALLAEPPLRRPAVAQIGLARAYLARKDVALARRAVEAALKLEPENAEARELAKKVTPAR
jgi:tetratricopeptide (TPR) repeat protein